MPRMVRRQYSDPYLRDRPAVVERREYYDGPNSVVEERYVARPSRPVSRASSRSIRMVPAPRRPRIDREESQSEEEFYARAPPRRHVFEEEDWYANRGSGRSQSRHGRSRSRLSTYDDGGMIGDSNAPSTLTLTRRVS